MARVATATRKSIGLGFLPEESRHGFLIHIPKGSAKGGLISISEYRGDRFSGAEVTSLSAPPPTDPALRVALDRGRWAALAPAFWEEANRRLRAHGLATAKLTKSPTKPIPVHPSLGKELCVLCWAVEEASIDDIPNALRNWEALAPEERWWLYTMTVATTGQAMNKGVGWRKALRAAIADNPFVKGEGMSPKARRELLGHGQLALAL
jgi:hypothetical protein